MWRPSRRSSIDGAVLLIIVAFLIQRGFVRQGQPGLGSRHHTRLTAVASNITISAVALVAAADLVLTLWRGGSLVRGTARSAHVRAQGGAPMLLGEVRLRRAEAVLLRVACGSAASRMVRFSITAADTEPANPALPQTASIQGHLAWQAERSWTGVLKPASEGARVTLTLRLDAESSEWAELSVRWTPTMVLAWK